jgi:flagellar protein FlgJ
MLSAPTSYLDFNSLAQLRNDAAHDAGNALDEAATQFEAQMIGMMLKSARQAKLGDGLFDNAQSEQYLEMMDQQVSLELARRGTLGLRDMLVNQLGGDAPVNTTAPLARPRADAAAVPATPELFVSRYAAEAKSAAAALGVDPKLLLAQAALETGWGKSLPRGADGLSSNNLFGIKASGSWNGPRVSRWTLEYSGGVAERRHESFRAYESSADSFADYVDLVRGSYRYEAATSAATNSEAFARELVEGGYATDPDYLDKWMAIYRGDSLNDAMASLK